METKFIGLAHIGIKVKDIEKSLAFYRDLLGFTLTNETTLGNGTRLAFLNVGDCKIELIQPVNANDLPAGVVDHFAITVEGIEALVESLSGKIEFSGQVATMPGLLGGAKNIFFKGPDGEGIEFFEYVAC